MGKIISRRLMTEEDLDGSITVHAGSTPIANVVPEEDAQDVKFQRWMEEVDKELVRIVGLESSFLPDRPYYEMFEDDYSPKMAAEEVYEDLFL